MKRILLALLLLASPAPARNKKKVIGLSLMSLGATLTAVGSVMFFAGGVSTDNLCFAFGGLECHTRPWNGQMISGLTLLSLSVAMQIASVPIYAQGVAEGGQLRLSVAPTTQGAAAQLSIRF